MAGEITLRGQVLAIGGVKEKVLAAHRNGLTTVILPKRNEQDVEDVPDEVKESMKFVFAESVDDVLDAALEKKKVEPEKRAVKKPAASSLAKKHLVRAKGKKKSKPMKATKNAKR